MRASDIDFFAADGHKWLLGPEGAGLFYIKQALVDELRPTGLGWNSTVQHYDSGVIELNLRPTAARFDFVPTSLRVYFLPLAGPFMKSSVLLTVRL